MYFWHIWTKPLHRCVCCKVPIQNGGSAFETEPSFEEMERILCASFFSGLELKKLKVFLSGKNMFFFTDHVMFRKEVVNVNAYYLPCVARSFGWINLHRRLVSEMEVTAGREYNHQNFSQLVCLQGSESKKTRSRTDRAGWGLRRVGICGRGVAEPSRRRACIPHGPLRKFGIHRKDSNN